MIIGQKRKKKDLRDYYRKSVYEYEKKKEARERKRIEQERLPKTEEEAFFINAKLIHDININYELITRKKVHFTYVLSENNVV